VCSSLSEEAVGLLPHGYQLEDAVLIEEAVGGGQRRALEGTSEGAQVGIRRDRATCRKGATIPAARTMPSQQRGGHRRGSTDDTMSRQHDGAHRSGSIGACQGRFV
jgi:hypothetical protein